MLGIFIRSGVDAGRARAVGRAPGARVLGAATSPVGPDDVALKASAAEGCGGRLVCMPMRPPPWGCRRLRRRMG